MTLEFALSLVPVEEFSVRQQPRLSGCFPHGQQVRDHCAVVHLLLMWGEAERVLVAASCLLTLELALSVASFEAFELS